jgi:hypothetical protein
MGRVFFNVVSEQLLKHSTRSGQRKDHHPVVTMLISQYMSSVFCFLVMSMLLFSSSLSSYTLSSVRASDTFEAAFTSLFVFFHAVFTHCRSVQIYLLPNILAMMTAMILYTLFCPKLDRYRYKVGSS